jgi:hypothetical protein
MPKDAAVQQLMRTKSLRLNPFLPGILILPAPMGAAALHVPVNA